jgi:hypothetical protein
MKPFSRAPKLDISAFPGTYWAQRRNFTTIEAMVGAFDPSSVLTVTLSKDGKGLMLNGYGPYRQVANGVFVSPTGTEVWTDPYTLDLFKPAYLGFRISDDGKVEGMIPNMGDRLWATASPLFNPQAMAKIAGLAALVTLAGALLWLWPQGGMRLRRPANCLGLAAAAAVITLPLAVMAGFDKGDSLIDQAGAGDTTRFWVMVIASNALLVVGLLLAVLSVRSWLRPAPEGVAGWASNGHRLHLSIVALAALAMAYALGFFNLIGFHIPG